MQRSRSPSPARLQEMRERERYYRNEMGTLEKNMKNSKYSKNVLFLLFSLF